MASERAATDRRKEVKRVLVAALVINLSMTGLKLVIGLISGSLAVIADAMHSATDALSSLMGLITNGLSDRAAWRIWQWQINPASDTGGP